MFLLNLQDEISPLISACNSNNSYRNIVHIKGDSLKADSIKLCGTNENADSIYKRKMLGFALDYANKNKDKDSFLYNSEQLTIDSGKLSIEYGHLFDKQNKHLIIRIPPIDTPYVHLDEPINIFLFALRDNHFVLLCRPDDSTDNNMGEYQGDTLRDINGDGYKDFVVNWYSGCGCCPRGDSYIYFYNPDNGSVTESVELLNATFLPGMKLVYLMDYGYPGRIELYKCKWSGLKLDTLESVSADTSHKGRFFVENEVTGKIKTVIGLPKEYLCIDKSELEWFLNAWDK
jgi:hypothetical protein